jgi:uncharacterized membrane protein (UPF0127 family)
LYQVHNREKGTAVANRVIRARNLFARTRGLMGAANLPEGAGLLLEGDNAIHTFFMRFSIDVAFLDGEGRVVRLMHSLAPWRATWFVWRARSVLELPSGTLSRSNTEVGDHLTLAPAD